MNHLAHFVLSYADEDLTIGNFVADFISNKELPKFTEGVKRGIFLHREIDSFTDAHPLVKQGTKRLHPFHHKYSPVIVDIYYDYLLARNWEDFTQDHPSVPPDIFCRKMYKLLKIRQNELPEKLRTRLPRMIADDFLMKATTYEGLEQSFARVEKYAAFPGNFGNAAAHLMQFLEDFDAEFRAFFPQLQEHTLKLIQK